MATHDVKFSVPHRPLGNADIEFRVVRDGSPFGSLLVSKGALVWKPGGSRNTYRVSWKDFDLFARQFGKCQGKGGKKAA